MIRRLILLALAKTLILLALTGVAYAGEDDPGWNCRTEGNHICGNDRWVQITQNRGGALMISRQSPRVAARRFQDGRGTVCITAIRRRGGFIAHFDDLCHD